MPPLLGPSPLLLDHSFPRSTEELRRAAIALGGLQELVEQGAASIALTSALRELVEMFDWEQPGSDMALLQDIYRYCTLLFLSPSGTIVMFALDDAPDYGPHPIPEEGGEGPLVEYWARDMGKLLGRHERLLGVGSAWCLGVICAEPFAGEPCPGYAGSNSKAFPLIGPNNLEELDDAYGWQVPAEVRQQPIYFSDARKHVNVLGALRVDPPKGGSHHKVHFAGARPWVLDPNVDPLPDRFLAELCEISGYPLPVVKYALKRGLLPPRALRLQP